MSDFIKTHFDKLLLTGLMLILFFATIHVIHHTADSSALTWLQNTVGQVLAALLTLMVGQRAMQRSADGNANGSTPSAPPVTPAKLPAPPPLPGK